MAEDHVPKVCDKEGHSPVLLSLSLCVGEQCSSQSVVVHSARDRLWLAVICSARARVTNLDFGLVFSCDYIADKQSQAR